MDQTVSYGGKYDDLLTSHARAIREAGETPSKTRLACALRGEARVTAVESERVVDDFCERGALQTLFGPGPYDEWLTAELEAARRGNSGLNENSLARKLERAHPDFQADAPQSRLLGLASPSDIVDDYSARYGLPSVLGPYPVGGIVIVVLMKAALFFPILWAIHYGPNALLGRPASGLPFVAFFLLFLAESSWKNWRRLRSPQRWDGYDAARDRLPLPPLLDKPHAAPPY